MKSPRQLPRDERSAQEQANRECQIPVGVFQDVGRPIADYKGGRVRMPISSPCSQLPRSAGSVNEEKGCW
jgi:hypothetical protein